MIRLASGLVLAGAVVAAILFLPLLPLRLLAAGVAALAAVEYLRIVGADVRISAAAAVVCWVMSGPLPSAGLLLLPLLMIALVAAPVLYAGSATREAAAGAFSLAYIGVPLGMLVSVH